MLSDPSEAYVIRQSLPPKSTEHWLISPRVPSEGFRHRLPLNEGVWAFVSVSSPFHPFMTLGEGRDVVVVHRNVSPIHFSQNVDLYPQFLVLKSDVFEPIKGKKGGFRWM